MIALLASYLIATNATPCELIQSARTMIPTDVELTGRLIMRNRRGVVQQEHDYVYTRKAGVPALTIDGEAFALDRASEVGSRMSIKGTDVTTSDISLDYLWWDDVSFDEKREGETVNGQVCAVVVLKKGERLVRVWVDRKTGALMQAEEYEGEKAKRRLWGTRLKKFGDRWMANVMEVETLGSGHRTKITVETLK